jgi:hypothetical protein
MRNHLILSFLFSSLLLLFGCASMDKLLDEGNYDAVIEKSINRLSGKKNKDPKWVAALERAFAQANRRDLGIINRYKREGQPHLWQRINQLYREVQYRQARVQPLLPLVDKNGYCARFVFADVESFERESRRKAAEYLYARAEQLLEKGRQGDKRSARRAYDQLQEINQYFSTFRDKEHLLEEAHRLGTTYILVDVKNQLPPHFHPFIEKEMERIGVRNLNSFWYRVSTHASPSTTMDYRFRLYLLDYLPGRERVIQNRFLREREVEDGWEYVFDENGNVAKDSLGNDIKQSSWKLVRAELLEVLQEKEVELLARVEWVDLRRRNILETTPLRTKAGFRNRALTFQGDERALTEEDRCELGGEPLPFPSDGVMLLDAVESLKPLFLETIANQLGV